MGQGYMPLLEDSACENCGDPDPDVLQVATSLANGGPPPVLCSLCVGIRLASSDVSHRVLRWARINPDGPGLDRPQRIGDVGYDLRSAEDLTLERGQMMDVPTNIRISLPASAWGEIRARSSIARRGLMVDAGIIDTFYTGPIFVVMRNVNISRAHQSETCDWNGRVNIKKGERIAQMILHPAIRVPSHELQELQDDPRRGSAGFGSTGK